MVSIADHTYHMLSRHIGADDEADFPLYPDPSQNMFQQQLFPFNGVQNFDMDSNSYTFARTQESYPISTGLNSNTMYAEVAPSYAQESPELRAGAPSNYSTASGPSAASSTMGSPHSIHNHIAPASEWPIHGLGLDSNPSIVGYDQFGHSNEYNFAPSGMEEFALDFPAKPHGFVGECTNVSRSASRQQGSISSNPESLSSLSTFVPTPRTMDLTTEHLSPVTTRSMASPLTPFSAVTRDSRDDCFRSPSLSTLSHSPISSRRPSQAFNSYLASSSRTRDMRSSPISAVSQSSFTSESPSFATYHQTPFFSQSSGNFVAPLESSCRFPLSIQRCLSASMHLNKSSMLTPALQIHLFCMRNILPVRPQRHNPSRHPSTSHLFILDPLPCRNCPGAKDKSSRAVNHLTLILNTIHTHIRLPEDNLCNRTVVRTTSAAKSPERRAVVHIPIAERCSRT